MAWKPSRSLLFILGVLCALSGYVSGDVYPARQRNVRTNAHRLQRNPSSGPDLVHEPESTPLASASREFHDNGSGGDSPAEAQGDFHTHIPAAEALASPFRAGAHRSFKVAKVRARAPPRFA